MKQPTLDIDRIVREVIERLAAVPTGAEPPAPRGDAKPPVACATDLTLDERVVSVAQIERRLEGVERVLVAEGSIITPAARDLLAERAIAVGSMPARTPAKAGRTKLLVAVAEARFDPAPLLGAAAAENAEVEQLGRMGLVGAVEKMTDGVAKGQTLGLLLSEQGAAATCLANRHCGVRAAAAVDVPSVEAAKASLGANLLVIDPTGKSTFTIERMVAAFCRGGARCCPEALREKLG